jgi:hypothetical protein
MQSQDQHNFSCSYDVPRMFGSVAQRPYLLAGRISCLPTYAEVLSNVNSSLDSWLDRRSVRGTAIVEFPGVDVSEIPYLD